MRCYTGYPIITHVVQKYKPALPIDGHIALTRGGGRVGDEEKIVGVAVERVACTLEGAYDLIHVRGVAAQKGIVGIGEGYIAR